MFDDGDDNNKDCGVTVLSTTVVASIACFDDEDDGDDDDGIDNDDGGMLCEVDGCDEDVEGVGEGGVIVGSTDASPSPSS